MNYVIKISKSVERQIDNLPNTVKDRILEHQNPDRQIQIEMFLEQTRDRHFVAHKQSFLQLGKTTETMYLISPILRK